MPAESTKHTPGPWAWLGTPGRSRLNAATGIVFDYAGYENIWPGAYVEGVDAANMQLIAAAPDLLEVLTAFVNLDANIVCATKADKKKIEALHDKAMAAIAKATEVAV